VGGGGVGGLQQFSGLVPRRSSRRWLNRVILCPGSCCGRPQGHKLIGGGGVAGSIPQVMWSVYMETCFK